MGLPGMEFPAALGYICSLTCKTHQMMNTYVIFFFMQGSSNAFLFRSRGSTRRSRFRVRGHGAYKSVQEANRIARRISYMLDFHEKKKQYYVLEQPLSSLLFRYRCIAKRLRKHGAKRVVISLGSYGANTNKPVLWLHLETCYCNLMLMCFWQTNQEPTMYSTSGCALWNGAVPGFAVDKSLQDQKIPAFSDQRIPLDQDGATIPVQEDWRSIVGLTETCLTFRFKNDLYNLRTGQMKIVVALDCCNNKTLLFKTLLLCV